MSTYIYDASALTPNKFPTFGLCIYNMYIYILIYMLRYIYIYIYIYICAMHLNEAAGADCMQLPCMCHAFAMHLQCICNPFAMFDRKINRSVVRWVEKSRSVGRWIGAQTNRSIDLSLSTGIRPTLLYPAHTFRHIRWIWS